jgi:hypothetical protein
MTLKHFIKIASLIALLYAGNASAVLLPVTCILTENTNPEACAIGEAQLRIDVTPFSTTGIDILFTNIDDNDLTIGGIDPDPGIHEIYFETSRFGTAFNLAQVSVTPRFGSNPDPLVRLTNAKLPQDMSPTVLPGGQEVGFQADFGTESQVEPGPGQPFDRGINESSNPLVEWGLVRISTFSFSAFEQALLENDFRIGLHVRSFGEASASFVTVSAIPVPAAFWLFGTALIGFVGFSRRRSVGA